MHGLKAVTCISCAAVLEQATEKQGNREGALWCVQPVQVLLQERGLRLNGGPPGVTSQSSPSRNMPSLGSSCRSSRGHGCFGEAFSSNSSAENLFYPG